MIAAKIKWIFFMDNYSSETMYKVELP